MTPVNGAQGRLGFVAKPIDTYFFDDACTDAIFEGYLT
jgi:hypothetical protein